MLHRLLLILLIGFVPFVNAESDLPDCPVDQPWVFDNCISTFTLSDGSEYVGEVNDTGMHGQGTLTTADGYNASRKLLLARRLIEAGVRVVSVSFSDFDTHRRNFSRMRHLVPVVDHALATLVSDLHERGMLDDVTIVAWGEFGRSPKVNKDGGRDHWPRVSPAILAGGGMNVGQLIGATDKHAGEATARPVHYQDVMATLYQNLGLPPRATTITDITGRPQYLCDTGRPIRELVG